MKAAESRLAALLRGPGQYVVPHFQRAYSWQRRQWNTLWADILELYELGTTQPHFMGSVVLLREGDAAQSETRLLIDGQQRVVTLSLFLAALRDLSRADDPALAERIDATYLLEGSEPRVVCSYQDQEAYTSIILSLEERPISPVVDAYRTFTADLTAQIEKGLDLKHLAEVMLAQLAFVAITLDSEDNPYRVFESLNAKGMPLTQGDLLRNYFFMRLPSEEHDEWFRSIWQPMQTQLGDALDAFMHDYLAKDGEDVREEEVYQSWRKRLAPLDVDGVKQVLRDLAIWAAEYDRTLHPGREQNAELRRRLEWLSAWSVTLRQPLLPFLLLVNNDYHRGALSSDDTTTVLQSAESFLARRLFLSLSNSDESQLLTDLYAGTAKDTDRVRAFITALSRPALGWPTDQELAEAMTAYPLYPRSHVDQRQLLLMALEQSYSSPTRLRVNDYDLELIAPLLPRAEWLAELGGGEDLHWKVVGTIGNLTWIERGQSSRVPLRPEERLQYLRRQARHAPALARDVAFGKPWTAEAIQERSRALADRATTVWPGPIR